MSDNDSKLQYHQDADALARTAAEVSSLYGFLARVFRAEVDIDLLRMLRKPTMRIHLREIGVQLDDWFMTENDEVLLEALAVEYAALLLGPGGHVNPHESVQAQKDGYLWGERTAAVRDFIKGTGIDYSETFHGIPDHIAVELEFLSVISRFESEEWARRDPARALNCLQYQQAFLDRHLGQWYAKFSDQLIEAADVAFYRDVAQLLKAFVASEIDEVKIRTQVACKHVEDFALPEGTASSSIAEAQVSAASASA